MSVLSGRARPHPLERRWDTGAYVVALAVNRAGRHAAAALGDGTVWLLDLADAEAPPAVVQAHDGACLALARDLDGPGFLTGGDDGRLRRIAPGGEPETLAESKGRWIEQVDAHPRAGRRAYAAGRQVHLLDPCGRTQGDVLDHPSTVGGLAFAPNGKRVAVAHYGGVSLWWTAQAGAPTRLEWKGSHLGVLWHPQGTHLMTTLQETGLHGWRLRDRADMQMNGYPTKIRSMGWTRGARHLATGGAESVVCWPFYGGGPWEKQPLQLAGVGAGLVSVVAPHPGEAVVAAGYDDGAIAIAPLDGTAPAAVARPEGSPASALAWSGDGRHLLVGTEGGRLSWFPIPARR
ncbi:WD40 repeat domain-containing protein [Azospirillum sp. ST 5-10]|uniref:WD40 repeat domain-containing protein n=1 Tax=unclassified Azospirillum TaxID=2630922 RepID=UPI003F4A0F68